MVFSPLAILNLFVLPSYPNLNPKDPLLPKLFEEDVDASTSPIDEKSLLPDLTLIVEFAAE